MGKHEKEPATAILWRNVQKLMAYHFGEKERSNQNKLADETGIGLGTAARIKFAGENPEAPEANSTGIKIIEKIARRFNCEPWQLLAPDFEPEDAKDRRRWRRLYAQLTNEERQKVFDLMDIFKSGWNSNDQPH
jgi:hypothetical protein